MPDRLIAATYARTSTPLQQTCQTQLAICRNLVEDRGWKLGFRLQDEGEKGHDPERPGYNRVVELVETRRVNVVVTWKLDRLFRSLKEASAAEEIFTANKVAIVSCTEPFDTSTSVGRFVFGFLANVAAFETDLIKERAQLGYERRAREGKWLGARLPYGYGRDKEGRLRPKKSEVTTIRLMHATYGRVRGDSQLADWLNEKGTLRRGLPWTPDQVRKVLTNRTTIGELDIRGCTASHPELAVLDRRRFGKTMRLRASLRHLGVHRRRREKGLDRVLDAYLEDLRSEKEDVQEDA